MIFMPIYSIRHFTPNMHNIETVSNPQRPTTIPGPVPAAQRIVIKYRNERGCLRKYESYNRRQAKVVGIFQLTLGIISILAILAVVLYLAAESVNHVLCAISSPVIWCIAGGFGMASARTKTMCTIVTTLVTSIISVVTLPYHLAFAVTVVPAAAWNLTEHSGGDSWNLTEYSADSDDSWNLTDHSIDRDYFYYYNYEWTYNNCTNGSTLNCSNFTTNATIRSQYDDRKLYHIWLAFICIVEFCVAIKAALLCRPALCRPSTQTEVSVRYTPVSRNQQQGPMLNSNEPSAAGDHQPARAYEPEQKAWTHPSAPPAYTIEEDPPPPYSSVAHIRHEYISETVKPP